MKSVREIKPIPKFEIWKKNTDAGSFGPRGAKLQEIDKLIKKYETSVEGYDRKNTLNKMHIALNAYESDHFGWQHQVRNKGGALTDLHETLEVWHDVMMPKIPNRRATDAAHSHSRLGIIWFFSNTTIVGEDPEPEDVEEKIPNEPGERSWYKEIWASLVKFCNGIRDSITKSIQKARQAVSWESIKGYPRKGREKLEEFYRENTDTNPNTSGLPSTIFKLLKKIMSELLGSIVGPISQVAQGVVKAVTAAHASYKAWDAKHNVVISAGTPATIVDAIKSAMNRSIGEGLLTAVKGGLGFIPGVGTVANKIADVIEKVYKFLIKRWEKARLKAFIADARQLWEERGQAEPFYARAHDFNKWFKSYTDDVPAVAMLALNSSCCGDKMVWLSMFNADGTSTTQGQFDAGVKFLDEHLNPYGTKYLNAYEIKFESADQIINTFISNASKSAVITRESTILRLINCLLGNEEVKIVERFFLGGGQPVLSH
ncbi:MAG TPA: hypothetical protein VF682_06960 [Pseudomonas sp.]|jgi:hypothetical protein